jgi:thiamine pyrophosphate-dependent acetolactate synthase large subunit-like protein
MGGDGRGHGSGGHEEGRHTVYYTPRRPRTRFAPGEKRKIGRTTGSALGWGVGAAIGGKLGQPDRQVLALQGDGGWYPKYSVAAVRSRKV